MIDPNSLIPPSNVCAEGVQVAMGVEMNGKRFFITAISKGGRWVFPDETYKLPTKLLGWTGFDPSWKIREWKDR